MKRQVSPWLILVCIAIVWRLIYVYWSPGIEHYLVPPGDDAAVHIQEISNFLDGHWALIGANGYPHGFHILMALIVSITGFSVLQAVLWITPLLLVIPIITLYYTGKKFFQSELIGAVAGGAWAFIALAPVRAFGDGNYPNLLAASIIMPIYLFWLYRFVISPSKRKIIPVLLLILLIALVHHLTLVYAIAITVPWLTVVAAEKLWEYRHHKRALRGVVASALATVLIMLIFGLLYGRVLTPYLAIVRQGGNLTHYLGGDSSTLSVDKVLEINSPLLVILGLVGLLALVFSRRERYLKLLFAVWVLVLIGLGSVPAIGLPGRFVRELAVPLSLLIGFLVQFLYDHAHNKARNVLIPAVVGTLFIMVWLSSFNRPFALPEPYKPLMRMQHSEEAAIPLLQRAIPNTVIANNSNPFLPFLLHDKKVVIIHNPPEIGQYFQAYPGALVYVAKQPPLSETYPFFAEYSQISDSMTAYPHKQLLYTLDNGSRIYQLTSPK